MTGPTWLVHSWGKEKEIVAAIPAWAKWGGESVAILDYTGNITESRIDDIRRECAFAGLRFIPGALFTGGSGIPIEELLDTECWRKHVTAALGFEMRWWCIDLEQWCGMNACEKFTDTQVGAVAAMLAQWCAWLLNRGTVPWVYGPWRITTGNPQFNALCRRFWEMVPGEVVLLEYLDRNVGVDWTEHPRWPQVAPMWLHMPAPPGSTLATFRAESAKIGKTGRAVYYAAPDMLLAAIAADAPAPLLDPVDGPPATLGGAQTLEAKHAN